MQQRTSLTLSRARPLGRPTKLQTVCARLLNIVHELGPGAKLPTVLQLRDTLGVSVATLNTALGELEAQHLIERRHGIGIFVSSRLHHKAISLVCDPGFFQAPDNSPFWGILVDRIRARAAAEDEEFSLHLALPWGDKGRPLNEGFLREITSGQVDGVLAVGLNEGVAEWIGEQGVPLVAFAGPGPYGVVLDSERVLREGVARLAARGCRRIGMWAPVAPFRINDRDPARPTEASDTFRQALAAHGLAFDPDLVRENQHLLAEGGGQTAVSHQEQGMRTALEVFGTPGGARPGGVRPDGIVSTDDMLTRGVLTALQKRGSRPGADLPIATHANVGSAVLLGHEDDLILIEVDPSAIVQAMFGLLETLMDGGTPAERWVRVPPKVRE